MDIWRTIGWNQITLRCPEQWDAIISGDTHLLFEDDFRPVLEVRWQRKEKHTKQAADSVLRTLARDSDLLVMDSLPVSWKKLKTTFDIKLLTDPQSRELKAALLTCNTCETTFLLYFFKDFAKQHHWDLTRVISSISCHGHKEQKILWSLQDFQVSLPASFKLGSYSFAAGLTRLTFTDKSLTMHLCRLASASQRLQNSTLTDLMTRLGDIMIPEEEILVEEHLVSHCSYPSITTQILSRFKRKSPFHYVVLRHHPEYDRLSGLFFFDKKPLPEELLTTILDSYEIFSL
ncbi:MAG TPA: hypothetical protein EYP35_04555 [Desulfobacterales bacterium]|nr:hypothetical protein [Desulfobacterales bacterium]HIP40206.1 hypothetical protein [Desulfocapsa sulfexigens]